MGYYTRYTKPFTILFKGSFIHILTEEEEHQSELEAREMEEAFYRRGEDYYDREDDTGIREDDTRIREEFPINDSKTFKEDQCVICLEEEPKFYFVTAVIFVFVKSASFADSIIAQFAKRKT